MVWSIASANASHVRVIGVFFKKYVCRPSAALREMERESKKTAAVNRRRCSTVVAVFAREETMDSCEARLR